MLDMTLYTHPHSRGVTVSWMLEECDAKYNTVPVQFYTDMKEAAYLAINPAGKVPALVVDGIVLTETAAIIVYLADVFSQKKLAPELGSLKRGEFYKWLFLTCNQFEPALTDKLYHIEVNDEMRFALGYPELDVLVTQVTEHLSNQPYLLGEEFSVADILMVSLLAWAGTYKNIMVLNDILSDYVKEATARPAFIRAQTINHNMFATMNISAE